jgi:hypothetical protein
MIRVHKAADIVDGIVVFSSRGKINPGDAAAILTSQEPCNDPRPGTLWRMSLFTGSGPAARDLVIDLPPILSKSDALDIPKFIISEKNCTTRVPMIIYFRDRLFMPERMPFNAVEREEVVLRVKKATYEEDSDISGLRAAVSNLEAALEFQKSGPKRESIPEDVKMFVWVRDGGSCRRCGLKQNLHFDHMIPVAKGGGSSSENIQILCQACNLAKSDKIAMT